MPIVQFHIHYNASSGEELFITYGKEGSISDQRDLSLHTFDNAHWTATIEVSHGDLFVYQYGVKDFSGKHMETGPLRQFHCNGKKTNYFLQDFWRTKQNQNQIFLTSAFEDIIFKRPKSNGHQNNPGNEEATNQIHFHLLAVDIESKYQLGVVGDTNILGNWQNPIIASDADFPIWKAEVDCIEMKGELLYKYVLVSSKTKEIVGWETGANRRLKYHFPETSACIYQITDEGFRHGNTRWRGAGVAIPIFSLRSKQSFGIGEFADISQLAELSEKAGMKVIQVLPVNDTIATRTWKDSYPYAAISVYALHPLFINIEKIAPFALKKDATSYARNRTKLNALEQIDFEAVLQLKTKYLRIIYDQEKEKTFKTRAFKSFISQNKEWLLPYAVFAYLRDINGTPDFSQWKEHQVFHPSIVSKLTSKKASTFDDVYFFVFQQYHADKQLKEAKSDAASKGIVLKGDLPIGIYRYSCDAWVAPELYNMNEQAGAPPDDYSVLGQNWGFPTYNWEEMAKDGYLWWQKRMQKLSEYFDALRIDHILGFFRIWQVPLDQVQGTMGAFNPRLPFHLHDLYRFGLTGDMNRYTQPFIKAYFLSELFGDDTQFVLDEYLTEIAEGTYALKEHVQTQAKIKAHFTQSEQANLQHLVAPLYQLVSEVLLIEEPGSKGTAFNPRITFQKTQSFQALDEYEKEIFNALYQDYYFSRHEKFWRDQAVMKLPALLDATRMFICGEDLGMIPASVPGVMKDLNIIPLEIQRMPKGFTQFGIPAEYPYLSVCSPSCHDMSTIRGWWEGDQQIAQDFYHNHLHIQGQAPEQCSAQIVEMINKDHLNAPSMLAIFPIQDLLGMDDTLKKSDSFSEQINQPSNPEHYWRYRLHLDLEDLNKAGEFLQTVKSMVIASGRAV
jgi:4-alpha-glucanotransferase